MKCTACQQDTIDARAKLPLLVGMPFRCRNCGSQYYIGARDIGLGDFIKYNVVGGLIYVFIIWGLIERSVWLLAAAVIPATVVLNYLPVALHSHKRHPVIQWLVMSVNVIGLGLLLFFVNSMSKTSKIHASLITDYLAVNPIVLEMVGPIIDITSRSSSSTGSFGTTNGATDASHIFIVTGEQGSEKICVVSKLSHDVEPPVLQINELWLIKEDGKKKIWP